MASHFTLYDLHEYIRRIFYLNFEEKIWVEAEIAESRYHNGHFYFSFVEKNENGELMAKASGALWRTKVSALRYQLKDRFEMVTRTGNKVRVLCKVEFHPRYGYSLIVDDFDPEYTEGFLYQEKIRTIARLKKEGLLEKNHQHPLPAVIQRIAVISSETAAGYQDFLHQLKNNPFGYQYNTRLFQSPMQGDQVRIRFPEVMESIRSEEDAFDLIIVVRGGGASIDLTDFDHYDVAAAIARSPLPVLSGIGHERDLSIADMVAARHVKTPTAAAEFIIQHNLDYERSLEEIFQKIIQSVADICHDENRKIQAAEFQIYQNIYHYLKEESRWTDRMMYSMNESLLRNVHREQMEVNALSASIMTHNPYEIMKRGYAMIFQQDKRITSLSTLQKEKPVTIVMNRQKIDINE